MKYVCLGYDNDEVVGALSDAQRKARHEKCVEYAETLRRNGQLLAGQRLQNGRVATTLRFNNNGKVTVTDGPFAETREQLGGIMVIEAEDLNHAIQLMAQMPAPPVAGCIEIRPIDENI